MVSVLSCHVMFDYIDLMHLYFYYIYKPLQMCHRL